MFVPMVSTMRGKTNQPATPRMPNRTAPPRPKERDGHVARLFSCSWGKAPRVSDKPDERTSGEAFQNVRVRERPQSLPIAEGTVQSRQPALAISDGRNETPFVFGRPGKFLGGWRESLPWNDRSGKLGTRLANADRCLLAPHYSGSASRSASSIFLSSPAGNASSPRA